MNIQFSAFLAVLAYALGFLLVGVTLMHGFVAILKRVVWHG